MIGNPRPIFAKLARQDAEFRASQLGRNLKIEKSETIKVPAARHRAIIEYMNTHRGSYLEILDSRRIL